jgi:prevent-host-death family protein
MRQKKSKANVPKQIVDESGNLATLVDQVIAEGAPIVVMRGGEPKAALVSIEDYTLLQQGAQRAAPPQKLSWEEWVAERNEFHQGMLAQRNGVPIDQDAVDRAWREAREELEDRDSRHANFGR